MNRFKSFEQWSKSKRPFHHRPHHHLHPTQILYRPVTKVTLPPKITIIRLPFKCNFNKNNMHFSNNKRNNNSNNVCVPLHHHHQIEKHHHDRKSDIVILVAFTQKCNYYSNRHHLFWFLNNKICYYFFFVIFMNRFWHESSYIQRNWKIVCAFYAVYLLYISSDMWLYKLRRFFKLRPKRLLRTYLDGWDYNVVKRTDN